MKKQSALAEGLRASAGASSRSANAQSDLVAESPKRFSGKSVLIGGHFAPEVRRTLMLVQAEPTNEGKNLKELLGEAINDLCAKYGKPQPYLGDF
ncbi:MAG: ribbon-helix-helix domain-containing protein [Janthinobacterium lividum]